MKILWRGQHSWKVTHPTLMLMKWTGCGPTNTPWSLWIRRWMSLRTPQILDATKERPSSSSIPHSLTRRSPWLVRWMETSFLSLSEKSWKEPRLTIGSHQRPLTEKRESWQIYSAAWETSCLITVQCRTKSSFRLDSWIMRLSLMTSNQTMTTAMCASICSLHLRELADSSTLDKALKVTVMRKSHKTI